jgi:hypothetical protein
VLAQVAVEGFPLTPSAICPAVAERAADPVVGVSEFVLGDDNP